MAARAQESDAGHRGAIVVPLAFVGDDAELVQALKERHPGAAATFYGRYAPFVERVITRVLGFDPELADVLQEVFLNALGSIHTLEHASALRPWLAQVTTRTARKVLRTRSRRRWLRLFVDPEDERRTERPSAGVEPGTLRALAAVYEVLSSLPVDERIAFALRFIEGMELKEVAVACRVSLATIKRRLSRAERRFVALASERRELEDWLEGGVRWRNQ